MDESGLFPGFGQPEDRRPDGAGKRTRRTKKATAPGTPAAGAAARGELPATEPAPAGGAAGGHATAIAAAALPGRMLTHEDFAANTLTHLAECPALAQTASAVVEHCLAARMRFPHTLLVGPADSSKRLIAQAIAADMAAPFHALEMLHINGSDALHAALKGIPDGAVLLVSGIDTVTPNALADLARAVDGRESVRDTTMRDLMRQMDGEKWKRPARGKPARAYGDFTVILTSRTHVPSDSALHRWVQLQFFTQRNAHTEAARLGRAFRRAGVGIVPAALAELARFAVTFKVRSLQAASSVALLRGTGAACGAAAAGPGLITEGELARTLEGMLEHAMDPEQVKKLRRFMRRAAA
jgi:hypothetical protein